VDEIEPAAGEQETGNLPDRIAADRTGCPCIEYYRLRAGMTADTDMDYESGFSWDSKTEGGNE